jgi:hypothetical protein
MSPADCVAHLDETEEEYLRLEPREDYDACIVGVVQQFNTSFLLYSVRRIVRMHMRSGMTYEEAVEYFDYNTIGAYLGPRTPLFLMDNFDHVLDENEETTEMT